MVALLFLALLGVGASRGASAQSLLGGGYQCQTCVMGMQMLHHRIHESNSTAALCTATWTADKCALAHGMNKTAYNECQSTISALCTAAAAPGDLSHETCTKTDFCGPTADTYPKPAVMHIWGECGGCQDLFTVGIQKTEKFVCDGLTKPIAAYCNAGAAICAYVLEKACNEIVNHFIDAGACATDICFEFHACGRAARSPCVK